MCPLPFVVLSPTEERRAREWPLETAELPEGHLEDWLEKRAKRLSSAPSIRCRPQGYPSSFLMEVSRPDHEPPLQTFLEVGPHWEILGSQTPARGSGIGELSGPLALLLIAHPIRLKERLVAKHVAPHLAWQKVRAYLWQLSSLCPWGSLSPVGPYTRGS